MNSGDGLGLGVDDNVKHGGKDFVLEVCRESTKNRCKRPESQCRYAHPPPNIHVTDGKVQCCADFLKGRCHRVSPPCRYFHPPPHLALELMSSGDFGDHVTMPFLTTNALDRLTSAVASAKAAIEELGSATNVSGGKQCERMEVCRDFLRGRCQRDDCRFAHPPDHVAVDSNNLVIVCIDFLYGRCSRPSCRYFHPPSHLAKSKPVAGVTICRDFLIGKCDRPNCRYVHSTEAKVAESKQRSSANPDVCKDFLNGRCNRPVCRFYHPASTSGMRPTAPESNYDGASADVCKDFLNGRCNRPVCRFYHPSSTPGTRPTAPESNHDGANTSVCKDFLNGRCNRPVCRYYHPPSTSDVRPGPNHDNANTDVCKDFLGGRCNRPVCRYYHPPSTPDVRPTVPETTVMSSASQSSSTLLGKRQYGEYDSYDNMADVSTGQVQYASAESSEVPVKKPATDYQDNYYY